MKQIFLVILILPMIGFAQKQSKQKAKPKPKAPVVTEVLPVKAADEYLIVGNVTGYPDGTPVSILNGQTGAPENTTTVKKNKFLLKGKIASPDFKIIIFSNQPPYITLFLDNSNVTITGTKEMIAKAIIKGSKSHKDFEDFTNATSPYQELFNGTGGYDSATYASASKICYDFVAKNPASFISPLAVIRYNQLNDEPLEMEQLYNMLATDVKNSSLSAYIGQLIAEAKRNAIGTVLPDFTQNDTAGIPVKFSSLRGKYVLVDFWASWCGPCRNENPNVVMAYNKYKSKNFTVLGVSLDRPGQKDAWLNAIKEDNLTWTHVSDLKFWQNEVAQQFGINTIPQNFLVGPDGKVLGKNLRGAKLERKLAKLLN